MVWEDETEVRVQLWWLVDGDHQHMTKRAMMTANNLILKRGLP